MQLKEKNDSKIQETTLSKSLKCMMKKMLPVNKYSGEIFSFMN